MIDKYYRFSLKLFLKSFQYAFAGVYFTIVHNQNMRVHITAALVAILLSIFFKITPFEMGILGVMIVLVISAEMINTAVEQMVDLITKEHRQEAKIAKDVAAGMVLVTAVGSIIVGILIFVPHILKLFR